MEKECEEGGCCAECPAFYFRAAEDADEFPPALPADDFQIVEVFHCEERVHFPDLPAGLFLALLCSQPL